MVDRYQRALAAGDLNAMVEAFEPDGYACEPAGAEYRHQGREGLRSFYESQFSNGGGIPQEHCSIVDDGRICALEYNLSRWGRADCGHRQASQPMSEAGAAGSPPSAGEMPPAEIVHRIGPALKGVNAAEYTPPRPGADLRRLISEAGRPKWRAGAFAAPRITAIAHGEPGSDPTLLGPLGIDLDRRPYFRERVLFWLETEHPTAWVRLSHDDRAEVNCLAAAVARDPWGWTNAEILDVGSWQNEKTAREAVKHGRRLWRRLPAWPWRWWDTEGPCLERGAARWSSLPDGGRTALTLFSRPDSGPGRRDRRCSLRSG
jgi:hypothetical protein